MKVRKSFVTNSSSSSFIVCFARIADKEKAQKIINKYKDNVDIKTYSGKECLDNIQHNRSWSKWLEWDWAGIDVTPSEDYINKYIDDDFIVVEDYADIEDPEWGDYDFDESDHDPVAIEAIDAITEDNGFVDIDCQYGAGRNG